VQLSVEVYHRQCAVFLDWLYKLDLLHRAPSVLSVTSNNTLLWWLEVPHQRITDLIALDLKLYNTYASILSD
jgi:hypothetical protein